MYKTVSVLCFLLAASLQLKAQVLPAEGSKLNYRLIGFSFPARPQTSEYKIEIAEGTYTTKSSFEKNIIKKEDCKTNKKIIEVPSFGTEYTWRVVYKGSSTAMNNDLHHFTTKTIPDVDIDVCRLRVLKGAQAYNDAYVFVDGNNALYDMAGKPVWFPYIKGLDSVQSLRDMKLTPRGTITFVLGDQAFEINYNGDVLWRAPNNGAVSGDSWEHYHHELTRLKNGHYMILGNEWALSKLPDATDPSMHIINDDKGKPEGDNAAYKRIFLGTVIEYGDTGNVVWSWKSSNYFIGSDVDNYRNPNPKDKYNIDVHENSFFFDEAAKNMYISFKSLNRIIKVKYPEGNVLAAYGEIYQPEQPATGNGLFCGQHCCLHSQDGTLLVYNNNSCNPTSVPQIIALEEPASANEGLKKVWEYQCTTEDSSDNSQLKYGWPSGGNIVQLPDNSLFACMGGTYSKVFIVNHDKKVLWSALPERWYPDQKKWLPATGYRASIITNYKAFEALVWNEELKE